MKAIYYKYILNFKRPSGTSRGVLTQKETWFIVIRGNNKFGIGECGILRGLSIDDVPEFEEKLNWACENIRLGLSVLLDKLNEFPSIQFGLEQAFLSFNSSNPYILFDNDFTRSKASIPINGLVWMGDRDFMVQQIKEKLQAGFHCIKMKIGAINFDDEIEILNSIRKEYAADKIDIRVDANGAFKAENAEAKLERLSALELHSIEQPIKAGNWIEMAALCKKTPFPIALDEELIGVSDVTEKEKLLQTIQPQYIILKPSLVGGFRGCDEWIALAKKYRIGWWITSALESNIGLNAIAQWTYGLQSDMLQGLGTGSLFTNNIKSPLKVENGALFYDKNKNWIKNITQELCI